MNHMIDGDMGDNSFSPKYKDKGTKDCPECDGGTREATSVCCGAPIDIDTLLCHECRDHSDISICELCEGTGEIEKDDNDIANDISSIEEAKREEDSEL